MKCVVFSYTPCSICQFPFPYSVGLFFFFKLFLLNIHLSAEEKHHASSYGCQSGLDDRGRYLKGHRINSYHDCFGIKKCYCFYVSVGREECCFRRLFTTPRLIHYMLFKRIVQKALKTINSCFLVLLPEDFFSSGLSYITLNYSSKLLQKRETLLVCRLDDMCYLHTIFLKVSTLWEQSISEDTLGSGILYVQVDFSMSLKKVFMQGCP